ncbi:hypothetical protein JUNP496_1745 [Acinetobacter baumannii]
MGEAELEKLIPNYKDVLIWQKEQNVSESCHYYFAQSFDDSENEISTSSQFYFDLKDALIAKLYFENQCLNAASKLILELCLRKD